MPVPWWMYTCLYLRSVPWCIPCTHVCTWCLYPDTLHLVLQCTEKTTTSGARRVISSLSWTCASHPNRPNSSNPCLRKCRESSFPPYIPFFLFLPLSHFLFQLPPRPLLLFPHLTFTHPSHQLILLSFFFSSLSFFLSLVWCRLGNEVREIERRNRNRHGKNK